MGNFNHDTFHFLARQMHDHADGYAALGLSGADAAAWANRGFLPDEAAPWIAAGFDPDTAADHADKFRSPAEARTIENARTANTNA